MGTGRVFKQKFGDKFDLKIGEQSLDEEFFISPSAFLFLHQLGIRLAGASSWGICPAAALAYPLAGLGVRGRAQLTDALTVLAGYSMEVRYRRVRLKHGR